MQNKILGQYKDKILPDINVINGNYNFYKGSESGNISMLNNLDKSKLIIENYFSTIKALRSEPVYNIGVEKVDITLSYYTKINKNDKDIEYGLNENTINNLGDYLSKILKRKVELRFIKITNPYLNREIIAEYIGKNASMYNFQRLINNAIRNTNILRYSDTHNLNILETNMPSDVIGMKITFSGRLVTERLRPRKTVSTAKIGTFTSNNKLFMEYGSYTGKNARGAFTVKVRINHKKGKNII